MSTAEAILDAAERRIRESGYNGFSFRDLAADVGIKSASVHHHFATKERLAAAAARRYADRLLRAVDGHASPTRAGAYRAAFRRALEEDGRMCLCGVLAAEVGGLPPEVAAEARAFFERCIRDIDQQPAPTVEALQVIALLEGAMLLARTLGDITVFDRATAVLG